MIHVFYSNHTERLLEALVADLREHRAPRPGDPLRGLFEPIELCAPNRNVQSYLELGIARELGIAAHLRQRFLNELLLELCDPAAAAARATGQTTPGGAPVLDATLIEAHLLDLLHDEQLLADPELRPVEGYLQASGARPEVIDRRRTQLAVRLARLFDEYTLSRPELLTAWPRQPMLQATSYGPAERWQRRLWLELRQRSGGRLLAEAFEARVRRPRTPAAWPRALFVFGFSYMALAYQRLLAALGGHTALHLYTLNPCMEFWEDVGAERRGASPDQRFPSRASRPAPDPAEAEGEDPFGLLTASDPPALSRWGRPGREHIRLLNALSDFDFQSAFVDPLGSPPTLLAQLQHDILLREPERESPLPALASPAQQDLSLRILACPSLRREVETIAEQIWMLIHENDRLWRAGEAERLRWNDIAVVVNGSDRDAYHAHIGAVFAEYHAIPFHVVDVSLLAESRAVQAARLLLELPLGSFTRQEVLRVVTHPLVLARYPEADPERWITLCDRLGIVHGADHEAHRGTYIDRDLYNWDQGLRRLVLGSFMAGERSFAPVAVRFGEHEYLPEELPASELESAGGLLLLLRSLLEDAKVAGAARLTLSEWATFISSLLASYLTPRDEVEKVELLRCQTVVQGLRALELSGPAAEDGAPRRYSYAVVHELCQGRLATLRSGHGQYLADGVVVSSLLPMRALPFRHVFIAGLGEGRFPRPDPADLLDLRRARRRAGDVTTREQDQYLFLETLLGARERLHLSYVARDPLTGESLAPSPMVTDLLEMSRRYVGEEAAARLVQRYPLRRHDETPPLAWSAEARREVVLREAGRDLRARLGRPHGTLELGELQTLLEPSTFEKLGQELRLPALGPGSGTPLESGRTLSISFRALERFLECPLSGWVQFNFRLSAEDDFDPLSQEDEPFELSALDQAVLLREVLQESLARGQGHLAQATLEATYDARTHLMALRGVHPIGVFGTVERRHHLATLQAWAATLRTIRDSELGGAGRPLDLRPWRFGRAEEHARAGELHDPIALELPLAAGERRVELYGTTQLLLDAQSSVALVARAPKSAGTLADRRTLRGFLAHMILAAAGHSDGGPHRAHVVYGEAEGKADRRYQRSFAPVAREAARAYLGQLVSELVQQEHPYFLPCEVAFYLQRGEQSLAACIEQAREAKAKQRFSNAPVRHLEQYPAPPLDEAARMLERRFGPFLRKAPP